MENPYNTRGKLYNPMENRYNTMEYPYSPMANPYNSMENPHNPMKNHIILWNIYIKLWQTHHYFYRTFNCENFAF